MYAINTLLANEFIISWFFGKNLTETLLFFLTIYIFSISRHVFSPAKWNTIIQEYRTGNFISSPDEFMTPGVLHEQYINEFEKEYKPSSIFLANNFEQTEQAMEHLIREIQKYEIWIVGMDCEKSSGQRGRTIPYLLQLASETGFCALFRLNKMEKLPVEIIEILQDKEIWKVGVGIENDVGDLEHRYYGTFGIEGMFDLRHLAQEMGYKNRSLKGLAEEILNAPHNKHKSGQKWDAETLSMDQIQYASTDAFFGVSLFFRMFHQLILRTTKKEWTQLSKQQKMANVRAFKHNFSDRINEPFRNSRIISHLIAGINSGASSESDSETYSENDARIYLKSSLNSFNCLNALNKLFFG